MPILLSYTMYAFYLIPFSSTAQNCMVFAREVLSLTVAWPAPDPETQVINPPIDSRLLGFIAVVALTIMCFLHFLSTRAGRDLNGSIAVLKVLFLLILIIAGIVKCITSNPHEWSDTSTGSGRNISLAFLQILFSFQGWENATFVSQSFHLRSIKGLY